MLLLTRDFFFLLFLFGFLFLFFWLLRNQALLLSHQEPWEKFLGKEEAGRKEGCLGTGDEGTVSKGLAF